MGIDSLLFVMIFFPAPLKNFILALTADGYD